MTLSETNLLDTVLEPKSQNANPALPKSSFTPSRVIETRVFPLHGPMLGFILNKLKMNYAYIFVKKKQSKINIYLGVAIYKIFPAAM